jgi:uncharacterized protein YjbJ (UPF0337 family)
MGFAQAGNRYPSRIKCGTGFFGIMLRPRRARAARDPASDPSRDFPARRLPLTPARAEPAPASGVVRSNRRAHAPEQRETDMDWNRVEGNWKQVKGKVKEKWGNLTDDDLDKINGRARPARRKAAGAVRLGARHGAPRRRRLAENAAVNAIAAIFGVRAVPARPRARPS